MEQIPNELLVHIFCRLHPVYDKLARFSVICKRWNNLIKHTSCLWEHIHLGPKLLTDIERNVVFTCFNEFEPFIKCLRVASLEAVFGDECWCFIHHVTYRLRNIACLDIPTFPWNLEQLVALKSADTLKELNLYGFWDVSDVQWTQSFDQPFSLINEGHLHLVKTRCKSLEVLKLSMNMLRVRERDLMDFLDTLSLKELHLSAHNSSRANISMGRDSLRLLKHLLSSHHASVITRLELKHVPVGHKELRLLLRLLTSLRRLKLVFHDIHRCMAGYQFLESKSLECFELNGLPAINIVNLKCSMPRLRWLAMSGCSNLMCLHVVSSMLERLLLDCLTNLRSLRVVSTTLKCVEVTDCSSLSSETIHKVLRNNKRIERCFLRGNLFNFRFFQIDNTYQSLTELSLWITTQSNVRHIQIHCQTLRSFTCNYQSVNGECAFSAKDCSVDLSSEALVHTYISLPCLSSVSIKCKELARLLLNVGQKNRNMLCGEVRVDAGKSLAVLCADRCLFKRAHVRAVEATVLDFNGCGLEEALTLEAELIQAFYLRSQIRPQRSWNVVTRCEKISKMILRECDYLATVNVFPCESAPYDVESNHLEVSNVTWPNVCNIHDHETPKKAHDHKPFVVRIQDCELRETAITCGNTAKTTKPVEIVERLAAMNCPCFQGVVVFQKRENSDGKHVSLNSEKFGEPQSCARSNEGATSSALQADQLRNAITSTKSENNGICKERIVEQSARGGHDRTATTCTLQNYMPRGEVKDDGSTGLQNCVSTNDQNITGTATGLGDDALSNAPIKGTKLPTESRDQFAYSTQSTSDNDPPVLYGNNSATGSRQDGFPRHFMKTDEENNMGTSPDYCDQR